MAANLLVYVCVLCCLGVVSSEGESCPDTYEYKDCGSPCTVTCDNYEDPLICTAVCSSGCFCPVGKVEHDQTCILPTECPATTTTSTPTTTSCPDTYEYKDCGSPCTVTCDNYEDPPICTAVCSSGCFCPVGKVEHDQTCILPTECLTATTTTSTPTTSSCPDSYEYKECGSPCAKTCDNYENPPFCTAVCQPGCFCPDGTVEHEETCITTDECPQSCPETYEYKECGSPCAKTCDNYDQVSLCAAVCVSGCFCPEGTVEHEGRCMPVEVCPGTCSGGKEWDECGSACPLTCDNYQEPVFCTRQCVRGCFCPQGKVDLSGVCVNTTTCAGCSYCQEGQSCVGVSTEEYEYAMCKDPIAVPCSDEEDLTCPEDSRCVTHNVTRESFCLKSCYLGNGGCSSEQVCYYERGDKDCNQLLEPCFKTICTDIPDEPGSCQVGWEINQCGSLCQRTCEDYITGARLACPEICAPPDCVCPQGMVVFRDRCVDPLECFSVLTNEPALNPLPVPSDSVLLLVTLVDIDREGVDGTQFAKDVENLVKQQLGFNDVSVSLFATLEAEDGSAVVVLKVKGGAVSRKDSSERLVGIMMDNPAELNHEVAAVRSVGDEKADPDESSDSENSSLSSAAIAGVTVAAVASVAVVAVALAIVILLVSKNRATAVTGTGNSKAKEVNLETMSYGKMSNKEELT